LEKTKPNHLDCINYFRNAGETDRNVENDFPAIDEINLIDDVATAFSCSRQKVVVVLNIGGVIETASWKNKDAILLPWQPGQEGEILLLMFSGKVRKINDFPKI
jgi:beta-glucosidase